MRTMWAIGTDSGDFDWQAINAPDRDAAIQAYALDTGNILCDRFGANLPGPCLLPCEWCGAQERQDEPLDRLDAKRVPMWDSRAEIKPMHWIRAGFGCFCEECGYETFADGGAVVYRGVVYCEDCRGKKPWRNKSK